MRRMRVDIEPSTHAEGVGLGLDDAVAPLPSGVAWVMCEDCLLYTSTLPTN